MRTSNQYCNILIFWLTFALINSTWEYAKAGTVSGGLAQKIKSDQNDGETLDAVIEFPSIISTVLSNPILSLLTGPVKTGMLINLMQKLTTAAQTPFIQALNGLGLKDLTPFWITNNIALKGVSTAQLKAISLIPGTFKLREPHQIRAVTPMLFHDLFNEITDGLGNLANDLINLTGVKRKKKTTTTTTTRRPVNDTVKVEWNIQKIGVPTVWSRRTRGEKMLVANIDTGVNAGHEALKANYGGQWFDAINGKDTPYDDNGHGTHTMGTLCGSKGIGVAPGAKWVACKGLDNRNMGTDVSLVSCAEWILKLRPLPSVVSNSWGGDQGAHYYDDVIKAWLAAGVFPVFASGNDGPTCRTTLSPGDNPQVISVGSTNLTDGMSYFSSRGPSVDGIMKPNVAAPGDDIISADFANVTGYLKLSGTSMATPLVSGTITLMLADNPKLTYEQIRATLSKTAIRPKLTVDDVPCGDLGNGEEFPNNAMGFGRISAANALGL